jgi:hypothetical protein
MYPFDMELLLIHCYSQTKNITRGYMDEKAGS